MTHQSGGEQTVYTAWYVSPLGDMLLACDRTGLTGVWFAGQRYFGRGLPENAEEKATPVLEETKEWLSEYFAGGRPSFTPPLNLSGTPFQTEVWGLLREIPYGETVTYGELARRLGLRRGIPHMSARAVGGAVGRNPVSVIVPCHRVIGADGSLTGYAGGEERKRALLVLEGATVRTGLMPDVRHGSAQK